MNEEIFAGPVAELRAVLEAREARVERRQDVLSRWGMPIVTVTPIMPGPIKDCAASRRVQQSAIDALENLFRARRWLARKLCAEAGPTGPEALFAVEAPSNKLKRALIGLETNEPWGRLWDLDVTDPQLGALSRQILGLPVRRCIVCDEPAHACARSRAHALDELLHAIQLILNEAPGLSSRDASP